MSTLHYQYGTNWIRSFLSVKSTLVSTPGNTVHYKSALKTPGTGKLSKKVSLSARTTTPKMLLKVCLWIFCPHIQLSAMFCPVYNVIVCGILTAKFQNKTPVTPHPQIISTKNKVKRLKFEESDESDNDDDEESDDERYEDEEDDEQLKMDDGKMKMGENDDSEDEDEDEVTDDGERESDEDKEPDNTKRAMMDVKAGLAKVRQNCYDYQKRNSCERTSSIYLDC